MSRVSRLHLIPRMTVPPRPGISGLNPGCKQSQFILIMNTQADLFHYVLYLEHSPKVYAYKPVQKQVAVSVQASQTTMFSCRAEGCCRTFQTAGGRRKHERNTHDGNQGLRRQCPEGCGQQLFSLEDVYEHLRFEHNDRIEIDVFEPNEVAVKTEWKYELKWERLFTGSSALSEYLQWLDTIFAKYGTRLVRTHSGCFLAEKKAYFTEHCALGLDKGCPCHVKVEMTYEECLQEVGSTGNDNFIDSLLCLVKHHLYQSCFLSR